MCLVLKIRKNIESIKCSWNPSKSLFLRIICETLAITISIRDFITRDCAVCITIILYILSATLAYILFSVRSHRQLVRRFPEHGTRIKIPRPIVYVCRYTSGRVLMRTVRGKEQTCYYPYHPTQEDSEEHLTPKRFHSRPPSKEDLSPSRYLRQYRILLLISFDPYIIVEIYYIYYLMIHYFVESAYIYNYKYKISSCPKNLHR